MSPVPRKQNAILLTEVVDEPVALVGPSSSVIKNVRRNRIVAAGALGLLFVLSFFVFFFVVFFVFGRDDAASTAPGAPSTLERLNADNERLRTRLAEIESEIARLNLPVLGRKGDLPAENDNAPITPRRFVPDGSERDDPFFGPKDSKVIVMVYSDFQCRLCREFHLHTIPKIRQEYADKNALKLIYRDFPLDGNANARRAAAFAQCAGEQGAYWSAFDLLNANEKAMQSGDFSPLLPKLKSLDTASLAQCLRSKRYEKEINADQAQALALGAKGAPSIFVGSQNGAGAFDGVFIRGAQPYPVIKQEIERALGQALP